ncbi:hypothetical protein D3C76_1312360 [compost metagenome]
MTNNEGMVVNNPTCVTDISGKSLVIAGMLAAITGPEEINNATDNNEYVLSFSMDIIKNQLLTVCFCSIWPVASLDAAING